MLVVLSSAKETWYCGKSLAHNEDKGWNSHVVSLLQLFVQGNILHGNYTGGVKVPQRAHTHAQAQRCTSLSSPKPHENPVVSIPTIDDNMKKRNRSKTIIA